VTVAPADVDVAVAAVRMRALAGKVILLQALMLIKDTGRRVAAPETARPNWAGVGARINC